MGLLRGALGIKGSNISHCTSVNPLNRPTILSSVYGSQRRKNLSHQPKYFIYIIGIGSYGIGPEPNRIIEFSRTVQDDPKSLIATIRGKRELEWEVSTILSADKIEVELLNTSQKVQQMMQAREGLGEMPKFEKNQSINFRLKHKMAF